MSKSSSSVLLDVAFGLCLVVFFTALARPLPRPVCAPPRVVLLPRFVAGTVLGFLVGGCSSADTSLTSSDRDTSPSIDTLAISSLFICCGEYSTLL